MCTQIQMQARTRGNGFWFCFHFKLGTLQPFPPYLYRRKSEGGPYDVHHDLLQLLHNKSFAALAEKKQQHQLFLKCSTTWGANEDFAPCWYLLVEISWSGESSGTVSDAGLTAADWDAVVLGLFEPAGVSPVRVVVNAAAVELECWRSQLFQGVFRSLESQLFLLHRKWAEFRKKSHLPLHIVDGTAGSVCVGAVVFVVNLLDGVIDLVFNLKQKCNNLQWSLQLKS